MVSTSNINRSATPSEQLATNLGNSTSEESVLDSDSDSKHIVDEYALTDTFVYYDYDNEVVCSGDSDNFKWKNVKLQTSGELDHYWIWATRYSKRVKRHTEES
jgi:hypothetical protein